MLVMLFLAYTHTHIQAHMQARTQARAHTPCPAWMGSEECNLEPRCPRRPCLQPVIHRHITPELFTSWARDQLPSHMTAVMA